MLKSVYLSNDNIKIVRHLIIFFIIVFTFLMVIGNKYFIPKNKKKINNNIETFLPSFGKEKVCRPGYYCGHGGEVEIIQESTSSGSPPPPCVSTEGTARDLSGNDCGYYDNNFANCGMFDTTDFKANDMCCECDESNRGGGGGGGEDGVDSNCNEEYEAQKKEGVACPTPCAPGQDQAWAAGTHESQIGANGKLLDKYKDNLGSCLKNFVNVGRYIS